MDDAIFSQFLRDQQQALAQIERSVSAGETNVIELDDPRPGAAAARPAPLRLDKLLQVQFDGIARRLADAYMTCDDEQRCGIRRLVECSPVALPQLGIAPDRIKLKIDGVFFRFALIYESMRDLRPDVAVAIARLDALCQAAQAAGIDANSFVTEVAAVSSNIPHSGQHSMRSLLLQRLVVDETKLCPFCEKRYPRRLPGCPHCAADPRRLGTPEYGPESLEAAVSNFEPAQELIRLPARQVLGLLALSVAAWTFAIMALVLAIVAWVNRDFYSTWKGWVWVAIALGLFGLLRYFRFRDLTRKYTGNGRWLIAISFWQALLGGVMSLGAVVAAIAVHLVLSQF